MSELALHLAWCRERAAICRTWVRSDRNALRLMVYWDERCLAMAAVLIGEGA